MRRLRHNVQPRPGVSGARLLANIDPDRNVKMRLRGVITRAHDLLCGARGFQIV